jgi:CHAT domain-containing protein
MSRALLGFLLFLAALSSPMVAASEVRQPSDAAASQIWLALAERDQGEPEAGAARLLRHRDTLPTSADRNPQETFDYAALTLYAASMTTSAGDAATALVLFHAASDGFAALGPGAALLQAVAMENAAALMEAIDGPETAYRQHLAARAVRAGAAVPPDATAIAAMERAGRLAMTLRDSTAILEELNVAVARAFEIGPASAGHPGEEQLLQVRAFAHVALLASVVGGYPVSEQFAGFAGQTAMALLRDIEWGAVPDAQLRWQICTALGPLHRELLGTLIEIGSHAEAARLLHFQIPQLQTLCAGELPAEEAVFVNALGARLYLQAGDPFSAHLRLRAVMDATGAGAPAAAEDALGAGIVRTRQAGARLALGFPGEAAALLAEVPEGLGMPETEIHERARLMAVAQLQSMQGRPDEALQTLSRAEALQRAAAPLHWYPLARIAYARALLLIETGAVDEAEKVRDAFEAELAAYVETWRDMARAVDADMAEDMVAFLTQVGGAEYAADQEALRAAGAFEHDNFRQLERLRMLHALARAAHGGDAEAAKAAFDAVPKRGLPGDTFFAGHAQRAYLMACLRGHGPGLRCELAASSAVNHPNAVPYACVDGCTWVMGEAAELVVSGDMRRRSSLVDQFAEPVLAEFVAAADAARAEFMPADAGGGQDSALAAIQRGTARAMGRFVGAGFAFDLAQRRIEGGASEAVTQLGARLAAGEGPIAGLMRERDALSAKVDALFRTTSAAPGEIERLTMLLDRNRQALNALRPDFAELFDPEPMQPEEIAAILPAGAAFVLITSTERATYVFAIRGDDFDWLRAPVGAAELQARVERLREALDPDAADRGALPLFGPETPGARRFDRALAHRIYRDLLEPFAPLLAGAELHVVADGPIGALPLSVLVRSPPEGDDHDPAALRATDWLARHHPVTMLAAPTGLRLARLQSARPRARQSFIGFGDPVFAPPGAPEAAFARLARLPGTRDEVARLAELLGADARATVHLGHDATKAAVLGADLADARIVAFATHGLLAGEIDGLTEPGLVFSAPPGAEADPAASYLTASEAATLTLNADWVLLSACNTAGADGRPDSRGLSGLARAFLFAGARAILVSHWPVRDDAAMLLTTAALSWHAGNPGASRARALQQAMIGLIDRDDVPDFAHPSAWAPFVLLGDG